MLIHAAPRPRALAPLLAALALAACTSPATPDAATDAPAADAAMDAAPPATCDALCAAAAARCSGAITEAACRAACATMDGGADPARVRACLASAGEPCPAARACLRPPASPPFATGTAGFRPRDLAGDFTLPTTDGEWRFRDEWTGSDHYVFVVYAPRALRFGNGTDYSVALFQSGVTDLLAGSPPNVHYFFLYWRDQADFEAFREGALGEIAAMGAEAQAQWRPRVHFVTERVDALEGWVGDLFRARLRSTEMNRRYDPFQWAIDRTQRVREVGQLGRLANGGLAPDLAFLAHEPAYYNFEFERERRLAAETATTVVQLFRDEAVVEETFPEVELPSAAQMATFDTLEVDLTTHCVNHRDGECGAWDYISDLRLCDAPAAPDGGVEAGADASADGAVPPRPRCDTEIARWITTYWREGRWVTDISGMLPYLREGGRRRFRWYASRQWDPRPANYIASLALRFSNRNRGMRPVEARRVFTGGTLNADYNANHPPVRFAVPAGVRRVELYALVTGHGAETAQCAEFCNHTHHWSFNGAAPRSLEFPEAQTADGCRERVGEGVVPNQHGTWYFGRGGWCPGWDVRPFVADVTRDVRVGMENEVSYRALIGRSLPQAGRGYGNVNVSAYVVFWQ